MRADVVGLPCNIRLCRAIGFGDCLRPPPDAGSDRLFGGGMFLSVPLGRCLNRVLGLKSLDLLGKLADALPVLDFWLWCRGGKAGLELISQAGQFDQVVFVGEWLV